MAQAKKRSKQKNEVDSFTHTDESRKNIPTSEFESLLPNEDKAPLRKSYDRRNRDLDPQLVWRGKDEQDQSGLFVQAPPLYIQEKVHPKALIRALQQESENRAKKIYPPPIYFPTSTDCLV